MHNIKDIRKDFNNFKEKLKNRNIDTDLDNIISLDEQNRKLIQEKESLEMEKKLFQNLKTKNYLKNQKNFLLKLKKLTKINQTCRAKLIVYCHQYQTYL